jgi:putative addiction module component (TIGR02574 family)
MSANMKVPPEFDQVSGDQRIAFVQELWDRIARHADQVPVPSDHKRILDERLNAYRNDPRPGQAWGEVRDQLLAKFRGA